MHTWNLYFAILLVLVETLDTLNGQSVSREYFKKKNIITFRTLFRSICNTEVKEGYIMRVMATDVLFTVL